MTRTHRRVHGIIWSLLAPALVIGLILLWRGRSAASAAGPAAAEAAAPADGAGP